MKRYFNGIAILTLVILTLAFLDASISGFLEPDTLFRAMPGDIIPVNGLLEKDVDGAQKTSGFPEERFDPNTLLKVTLSNQTVRIHFEELKGRMWRGTLTIPDATKPGEQQFWVHGRYNSPSTDDEVYVLRVFADEASYRADFKSLSMRWLGVRPWIAAASLFPVGILLLGGSFFMTGRAEAQRQTLGIGSIYKLAKHDEHWEVIFGLGSKHGVREGDRLLVLNASRSPVADLVAQKVRADFSIAQLSLDAKIEPGYFVARKDSTQA
ncbi:hypothetical protein [Desulfocurvibacter africanus]|uniref:hypothetical protein n=1 Tax=Desulfocurvibacter africanus TaxID=873 RepID=UPI000418BBD6|nr:hypothetical protein [Desulfocurvibacter africanus]